MGTHGLLDLGWTAKLDDPKKHFGVCRMGRAAMFVTARNLLLAESP